MTPTARYAYTGTALPGNAETVTLLELGVSPNTGPAAMGLHRYLLHLWNSQAGTLNIEFWDETALTYRLISTTAVSLTTTVPNVVQAVISPYRRIRVQWVNGATPQTIFQVNQCCLTDPAALS